MAGADDRPRAVVVLVRNGREVVLGPVDRAAPCDLGVVDDLLRLQLEVRRTGWSLEIREVAPELQELFELVGLTDQLKP